MGRSAKLYKKKPKSALQKQKSTLLDQRDDEEVQVSKKQHIVRAKQSRAELEDEENGKKVVPSAKRQHGKLKSKLWKELDSQRSNAGLREYATPKQAGVDYLKQWEGKTR